MSESGFTQFPAGPTPPGQNQRSAGPENVVRITGLPQDLREVSEPARIRGEVTQQSDNRVRIRTERGDIEVQARDNGPRLKPGDRVEVEIQPGRPPEEARIRREANVQRQPSGDIPPDAKTDRPPQGTEQIRQSATPVEIKVQNTQSETPRPDAAAQARPAETPPQIVRLEPIPPAQAAEFITQPAVIVETALINVVEHAAQIIAHNAASDLARETVTLTPPPQPEVTLATPRAAAPSPVAAQATTAPTQTAQPSDPQTIIPAVFAPITQVTTSSPDTAPQVISGNFQPSAAVLPTATLIQPAAENSTTRPILPAPQTETASVIFPPNTTANISALQSLTTSVSQAPQGNPLSVQAADVTASPLQQPLQTTISAASDINVQLTNIEPAARLVPPATQVTAPATPDFAALQKSEGRAAAENSANLIVQNLKPGSIPATVIGQTPENLPVIQISSAQTQGGESLFFIAHTPLEGITPGTNVTVTPVDSAGVPQGAFNAALSIAPPMPFFLTPEPWPLMNDIYQTLNQASAQAAQAFSNVTPSPASPARMGPAMMFFVAAVMGGDLSQWLGNKTTDILRRSGRSALISRLGQEGNMLTRMAAEPVAQDWRALSLPMFHDGEIRKIALYYKQDDSNSDQEQNKGKNTRFVFDLTLDHMGRVQLDALFQPGRLDAVLRTEENFNQNTQADMRRRYADALRQTQISGELSFQNSPDTWVTITPESARFGVSA